MLREMIAIYHCAFRSFCFFCLATFVKAHLGGGHEKRYNIVTQFNHQTEEQLFLNGNP